MRTESQTFFTDLLDAAGPSGDERAATRVWRRYAEQFAEVKTDSMGSTSAAANPGGTPVIGVFGHIDEIGLVIVHIDDEGYLWFAGVGGWTPTVLLGQRIRVLTKSGPVVGAIGKKPPHLSTTGTSSAATRSTPCGSISAPPTATPLGRSCGSATSP